MENTSVSAVEAAPEKPAKKSSARDWGLDNIKAMLIMLVVFGHILVSCKSGVPGLQVLYECIYTFHVPLFVLVSGYFAKKSLLSRREALYNALPTFLIFALLFTIVRRILCPADRIAYANPPFALWYLLCLFYWRFLAKDLSKLKGFAPVLLVAAGLAVGLLDMDGSRFSFFRAVAFFPFFWLGIIANGDTVAAIRKHIPKWLAALGIAAVLAAYCGLRSLMISNPGALAGYITKPTEGGIAKMLQCSLQMSYSYKECGFVSPVTGMAVRLALYAAAFVLCVLFVALIPNKKTFLTRVGASTLAIYVGHTYIVYFALRKFGLMDGIFAPLDQWGRLGMSLLLTVLITAIFSMPFFDAGIKFVTGGIANGLRKLFGTSPALAKKK